MTPDATIESLPTLKPAQRGGPRYVQMRAASRGHSARISRCTTCQRLLAPGELHAYDRVRGFGSAPRRYCAECWAREPRVQVMR
jgi:hypothetical protein